MSDGVLSLTSFVLLGSCVESVEFNGSEAKILNRLNESTCMTIEGKSSDKNSVIIKLEVDKTCVNGPEVSNMFFEHLWRKQVLSVGSTHKLPATSEAQWGQISC